MSRIRNRYGAIGAGVAVLTVCLAVVVLTQSMSPEELSAWATYFTSLATVAAFAAAVWAGLRLRDQMEQAERHHNDEMQQLRESQEAQLAESKRSREAAMRPVLRLVGTASGSPDMVELTLRNVGPGPALDIQIDAWERNEAPPSTEDGTDESREAYVEFMDDERKHIGYAQGRLRPEGDQAMFGATGLIAPNTEETVQLWAQERDAAFVAAAGRVWYHVIYEDVFGNKFQLPDGSDQLALGWHYMRRE